MTARQGAFPLVALALVLTGCAAPPNIAPVFLMPRTVEAVNQPVTDDALGKITVTVRQNGKVENYINESNFRIALREVLKRSNLFGENLKKPIAIHAEIFGASAPEAGMTMTSYLAVQYKVTNSDGKVLMDEPVSYEGKANFGQEWLGASRAMSAFQQGIQGHMTLFLQKLRTALEKAQRTSATR